MSQKRVLGPPKPGQDGGMGSTDHLEKLTLITTMSLLCGVELIYYSLRNTVMNGTETCKGDSLMHHAAGSPCQCRFRASFASDNDTVVFLEAMQPCGVRDLSLKPNFANESCQVSTFKCCAVAGRKVYSVVCCVTGVRDHVTVVTYSC